MALTFSFNSVRDLMAKLEREAKALNDEAVTGDRFFNFAITGYSMIDWVKQVPSVPASAKQASAVQERMLVGVNVDTADLLRHWRPSHQSWPSWALPLWSMLRSDAPLERTRGR